MKSTVLVIARRGSVHAAATFHADIEWVAFDPRSTAPMADFSPTDFCEISIANEKRTMRHVFADPNSWPFWLRVKWALKGLRR